MIFRKGNVSTAKEVLNNSNENAIQVPKPMFMNKPNSIQCALGISGVDKKCAKYLQLIYKNFPDISSILPEGIENFRRNTSLISSIPIYLVTDAMISRTVPAIDIPSDNIKTWTIPSGKKNVFKGFDKDQPIHGELNCDGLYMPTESSTTIKETYDLKTSRRIIIYVERLKEEKIDYEILLAKILLHELSHAIIDVYDEKINDELNDFNTCKEESLAEGLSLYLAKKIFPKYFELLKKETKDNKFYQYRLGLAFATEDVLKAAIHNWMSIKSGRPITKDAAKTWLNNSKKFLNSKAEDIINYDNALYNSAQTNP